MNPLSQLAVGVGGRTIGGGERCKNSPPREFYKRFFPQNTPPGSAGRRSGVKLFAFGPRPSPLLVRAIPKKRVLGP